MSDRLTALRIFRRVARSGSFSAAARELGLSQPSVSRIVADLERDVGAALLSRTTRAVTLTAAGSDYLARVEDILAALDEADHAARGTGELRGTLRIALSSSLGVREVIPRLPDFLQRHPSLDVDLAISDLRQDLIAEGVDVALRFGTLAVSSIIARRLAEAPLLLVASPGYLAAHGRPAVPAELAGHSVILGPVLGAHALTFAKGGRQVSVRVEGRLTVAVNEGAIAAAVAGLGITATSLWGCRRELEAGTLVKVLEDWPMPPVELHAVFPPGRAPAPAARAFSDYIGAQLRTPS